MAFTEFTEKDGNVVINEDVKIIPKKAFYENKNIKSVVISDKVKKIGKEAFYECSNLTTIIFSNNLTTIESFAFYGCEKLTEINIPDTVTSIGEYAFSDCENLASIKISNKITSIEERAFFGCKKLTEINIPDTVTSIGEYAFSRCENLTTIKLPENITLIDNYAFTSCKNLTKINIPDTITSIGSAAFNNCKIDNFENNVLKIKNGLCLSIDGSTLFYVTNSSLASITIPDGIKSIEYNAFYGCENLMTITIPISVTSIRDSICSSCKNLKEVIYTGTEKEWNSVKFDRPEYKKEIREKIKQFALNDAKKEKIAEIKETSFLGFMNEISDMYEGFKYQILNETKTNKDVFIYCNKNAIILQLSSNILKWNEKFLDFMTVFSDLEKTNEEVLESLSKNELKISEIKSTFPIINIEFDELNFFAKNFIRVGRGNKKSGFFSDSKIKKFSFGTKNITTLEEELFSNHKNLTTITIPNGVIFIEHSVFFDCQNLTEITIPNTVTSIGTWAFYGCENLKEVIYEGSKEEWENIKIENYNEYLTNANITFKK